MIDLTFDADRMMWVDQHGATYIVCTDTKMMSALRLERMGAQRKTIKKFLSINDEQYNNLALMKAKGKVYYVHNGIKRSVDIVKPMQKKSKMAVWAAKSMDEMEYGDRGGLPEYIVQNFSDETVGNYKNKKEG